MKENDKNLKREAYLRQCVRQLVPDIPEDAIHFECVDVFRQEAFRGLVADYILHARFDKVRPPVRLLAILLRRSSPQADKLLEKYRNQFMPELSWLLLDEKGGAVLKINSESERRQVQQELHALSGGNYSQISASHRSAGALFSANNQWLWKVLLLSGMDSAYWNGPRLSGNVRVGDLAAAARKPQPSVSLFFQKAEQAAVIERQRGVGHGEFIVRNIPQLLEQWAYDLQGRHGLEFCVNSLYPGESADNILARMKGADDVVISGQAAAHLYGLGVSNSRSPLVYVRDLAGALRLFDLSLAKPGDAGVLTLCVPQAADAVFDGAVLREGLRLADILQVWLDVRLRLDRGQEQAEHLWERVLAPFFRSKRWL